MRSRPFVRSHGFGRVETRKLRPVVGFLYALENASFSSFADIRLAAQNLGDGRRGELEISGSTLHAHRHFDESPRNSRSGVILQEPLNSSWLGAVAEIPAYSLRPPAEEPASHPPRGQFAKVRRRRMKVSRAVYGNCKDMTRWVLLAEIRTEHHRNLQPQFLKWVA